MAIFRLARTSNATSIEFEKGSAVDGHGDAAAVRDRVRSANFEPIVGAGDRLEGKVIRLRPERTGAERQAAYNSLVQQDVHLQLLARECVVVDGEGKSHVVGRRQLGCGETLGPIVAG